MGTLRIILAMAVVLGHCGGFFGYTIASGVIAVQIFYMISGFFMALVLSEKKIVYASKRIFYLNRFIRIYSTYYVVLAFCIFIYLVMYVRSHEGPLALIESNLSLLTTPDKLWLAFTNLFIFGIESSLFMSIGRHGLILSSAGPVDAVWPMILVVPAWSIGLELLFYIIVPFLSKLKSGWLVAIVALSLALRIFLSGLGFSYDPWNYRFFPLEIAFFISGMLSYRASEYILAAMNSKTKKVAAVAVILCVCLSHPALNVLHKLSISGELFRWPLYAFVLVALPALFSETRHSKWDSKLADFSYPLYLIHWPIIMLYASIAGVERRALNWHTAPAAATICVAVSLVSAWILIRIVEAPTNIFRDKLTRRLTLANPTSTSIAVPAFTPDIQPSRV